MDVWLWSSQNIFLSLYSAPCWPNVASLFENTERTLVWSRVSTLTITSRHQSSKDSNCWMPGVMTNEQIQSIKMKGRNEMSTSAYPYASTLCFTPPIKSWVMFTVMLYMRAHEHVPLYLYLSDVGCGHEVFICTTHRQNS